MIVVAIVISDIYRCGSDEQLNLLCRNNVTGISFNNEISVIVKLINLGSL